MKNKPALVWDHWNKEHIKKHKVTVEEVEEAYKNEFDRSPSHDDRLVIFGKTKKQRFIIIAISFKKQPDPYVLSARAMSKKERKEHYEKN